MSVAQCLGTRGNPILIGSMRDLILLYRSGQVTRPICVSLNSPEIGNQSKIAFTPDVMEAGLTSETKIKKTINRGVLKIPSSHLREVGDNC